MAVITIVFAPSTRVIVVLKLPLESTVTSVAVPPFILTVTDLTPAVTSLVLPVNTQDALLVTRLLVGADTDNVGGVASTLKRYCTLCSGISVIVLGVYLDSMVSVCKEP